MIRILIADDHPIVRAGLCRIVADEPDIELVGEVSDAVTLLEALPGSEPDVLLLDVAMPGPGFLEVLERVRMKHPAVRILVLSIYPEDQYALRALQAGAAGYLTKDQSPEQLVDAIRRVAAEGRFISTRLAELLAIRFQAGVEHAPHEALSSREFQVLCLLGGGHSVTEAGALLHLSPKTISTYRARILGKLQLSNNAGLVRYVHQHELR